MTKKCTVVLADDHPMFRLGLKAAIETDQDYHIVGEASDGESALELIERKRPALAVVDWKMPKMDGLSVLKQIVQRGLATRVIILTMYNEEQFFNEALDAGVEGFVLKENAVSDIVACLRTVRTGEIYLSPAVSNALLKRTRKANQLRRTVPGLAALTAMEQRVLTLVAEKKSTRDIASELGLSPYTIETHRRNISQKLNLQGSHSLLRFALNHKDQL